MPEGFSGARVHCDQVPFDVPREHQAPRRRKRSGPGRGKMLKLPLNLARPWINRAESTPVLLVRCRSIRTPEIHAPRLKFLRPRGEEVALLARVDIEKPGLCAVGRRHEVRRADGSRTHTRSLLGRVAFFHGERAAGGVQSLCPRELPRKLFAQNEFSI